jgi:Tol biopolymer transport system component
MKADGTGRIRLTNNVSNEFRPIWSPDGTKVAFESDRDGFDIYSMDSDGTSQTRLTNDPDLDVEPTWSPDGAKIAFTSYREGTQVRSTP